jgi:glycosyltransferase involved in cell wall biosynthesis
MLNAIFFQDRRKYSIFFTECIRIPQLIMKRFGLLRHDQKVVALMADESLYFMQIRRYPRATVWIMRNFLRHCDAIVCIGRFQTEIASAVIAGSKAKLYTIFNGVPDKVSKAVGGNEYDATSNQLLFIGNASVNWRIWYKGIDLMLKAFNVARQDNPTLRFVIVGEVERLLLENILDKFTEETRASVHFTGPATDIAPYFRSSALYFHCARGDAFPTTVLESMAAGIVPLISMSTGTVEIVEQVGKQFIVPLEPELIAKQILWFFSLSEEEKLGYSRRCKDVMKSYTEDHAVTHFDNVFHRLINDLKV